MDTTQDAQNVQPVDTKQDTAQPIARTKVIIYTKPGMGVATTWNSPRGYLEWGSDGRVRLYDVNQSSNTVTGTVFDILPQEVVAVRPIEPTGFTLWLADGSYTFTFSKVGTAGLAVGGVFGLMFASHVYKKSGAGWWVDEFTRAGAERKTSPSKIGAVVGFTIAIVLCVIFPLIVVLFHAIAN
jgi:hypothetical protein